MAQKEQILEVLKTIVYPGTGRDLVSFGMVKDVSIQNGEVTVHLRFVEVKPEIIRQLQEVVLRKLERELNMKARVQVEVLSRHQLKLQNLQRSRLVSQAELIPKVQDKIAVASGKGGVGKSTVATNISVALARLGKRVGILDADVYGPNLPRMFGVEGEKPHVVDRRVYPIERFGVKVMSLGILAPTEKAMIWRGPLVGKAIEQMLRDTEWGELDFLVIDLPPGTGDAQLTLSQRLQLTGAVMVTTPQEVALSDAVKGIHMFREVAVPIIGLVENMAIFICPNCQTEHDIFPGRKIETIVRQLGIEHLGKIPLDPQIAVGADRGEPVVITEPRSQAAQVFLDISKKIIEFVHNKTKLLEI